MTDERRSPTPNQAARSASTPAARVEEVWRLTQADRVASCELRDDSYIDGGFAVVVRQDDALLMIHRCDTARMAGDFATAFKQDYALAGWTEPPATVVLATMGRQNITGP